MKYLLVIFTVFAMAGCAETNEDRAKDLISERLKTTLPDYENYESVNHGKLGKAFLPYEETPQYVANVAAINSMQDSIKVLEMMIGNKTGSTSNDSLNFYKQRMQALAGSTQALRVSINQVKMSYVPQQLYKLTHSYKMKAKSGIETVTEDAYYFDKDVTKIIKVTKVN